jgi:hypothetical protein
MIEFVIGVWLGAFLMSCLFFWAWWTERLTINAAPQEKAGTRGSSATQSPEPPAGAAPLEMCEKPAQGCSSCTDAEYCRRYARCLFKPERAFTSTKGQAQ